MRLETSLEQTVVCPETIKPIDEERFYRGIESLPQTLINVSFQPNVADLKYFNNDLSLLKYSKFEISKVHVVRLLRYWDSKI